LPIFRSGASLLALLTAGAGLPATVQAQDVNPVSVEEAASEASEEASEIVVTGSRVARSGFTAPTPVTAVSSAEMEQRAPTTIADTLATIPSFRSSNTPQTSGVTTRGGGIITADLRALGTTRTLVLIDGHRFVPSGSDGLVDLKLIPQLLIDSAEVVTGGASAAYGSDAVAGVVNFKLNTRLRGIRGSVQGGISEYGDAKSLRASLAAGGAVADGRLTYLIGVDYSKFHGVGNQYSRPWGRREVGLVVNPLFATDWIRFFSRTLCRTSCVRRATCRRKASVRSSGTQTSGRNPVE
jgi:iron complex outermembrane recepter protein